MAIIEGGTTGSAAEVGAAASVPLHVVSKPQPYGVLGHYSLGLFTGILPAALGANSEVMQFRWVDATRFALIRRVLLSASVTTTFFAAGVPVQIDMVKATAWSAQGTGGSGTTMAATTKRRTSMGSSLLAAGDCRIATTAALGAGTKTLEANSLAGLLAGGPITASLAPSIFAPNTVLFDARVSDGDHPLLLVANEGFVVRSIAVPATGTWRLAVQVDWSEVTAY